MAVVDDHARVRAWLPWIYGLSFAGLGSLIPYLALLLQDRGITGWTLAAALAVLPISRLLVGPVWSVLADMFQAATWLLRLGAVLAVAGSALLWHEAAGSPGMVIAAMALLSVGRAPCGPVLDGLAIRSLQGHGPGAYGRVRRWGSVGFMLAALGVGWLTEYTWVGPLEMALLAAVLFLGVTLIMPSLGEIQRVAVGPALSKLSRDPHIWFVLVAAALHFSAHVGSTSFLAVHFHALGYSTVWAGSALAFGVAVEVGVMTYATVLLTRWSPAVLLVAAIGIAWMRWWGMSNFTEGWVLVGLQGMHGITFGVFWISAVALMNRRAPAAVTTSAQGLLAAAVGGVGSALGMIGSSLLVEAGSTTDIFVAAQVVSLLALLAAFGALWTR